MTDDRVIGVLNDDRLLNDVEVDMIREAIVGDGASLVYCSSCDEPVGVDEYGLACSHDHDHAPILDDVRFDDVFESPGVIGRLRRLVVSAFE